MHSELTNIDDEIFWGWMSDLEDDVMEPLLDAEGDGHDNESTNAPEKHVWC